jgi:hypothetical protein
MKSLSLHTCVCLILLVALRGVLTPNQLFSQNKVIDCPTQVEVQKYANEILSSINTFDVFEDYKEFSDDGSYKYALEMYTEDKESVKSKLKNIIKQSKEIPEWEFTYKTDRNTKKEYKGKGYLIKYLSDIELATYHIFLKETESGFEETKKYYTDLLSRYDDKKEKENHIVVEQASAIKPSYRTPTGEEVKLYEQICLYYYFSFKRIHEFNQNFDVWCEHTDKGLIDLHLRSYSETKDFLEDNEYYYNYFSNCGSSIIQIQNYVESFDEFKQKVNNHCLSCDWYRSNIQTINEKQAVIDSQNQMKIAEDKKKVEKEERLDKQQKEDQQYYAWLEQANFSIPIEVKIVTNTFECQHCYSTCSEKNVFYVDKPDFGTFDNPEYSKKYWLAWKRKVNLSVLGGSLVFGGENCLEKGCKESYSGNHGWKEMDSSTEYVTYDFAPE